MSSLIHYEKKRIIGAGLPRTGTTSLTAALEILGLGPVAHCAIGFEESKYARLLQAKCENPEADANGLFQASGVSLAELTAPYNATLDSPLIDFFAELNDLYPNSLVVLSVRDTDEGWWRSWDNTVGPYSNNDVRGMLLRAFLWPVRSRSDKLWMMVNIVKLWRRRYGSYGPLIHQRHNKEVIRRIPRERLLVFNVKEGWEPLCKFLGVDVPDEPFPQVNDSKAMNRGIHRVHQDATLRWGVVLCILAWAVYAMQHFTMISIIVHK